MDRRVHGRQARDVHPDRPEDSEMKWRTRLATAIATAAGVLVPSSDAMAGIFLANHTETLLEDDR
jgi:hypothetical protein